MRGDGRRGSLWTFLGFLSAPALAIVAGPGTAAEAPDPKALDVADRVLAFSRDISRNLRFTFVMERDGENRVSRTRHWDVTQGMHRLEMSDRNGKRIICLTHLESMEGVCTLDGEPRFDEKAKPFLERAHADWINDSYWLLMPYRMKHPGVHLK